MKKKILTVAIAAFVLVLPTIVAIISYTSAQNNPVTKGAVSQIAVSSPDGKEYTFLKGEKEGNTADIFNCFFAMNSKDTSVSALPADPTEYQCFTAEYTSYNKKSEYKYYLTQDPNNAYFCDSEGKYYKISPDAAASFLSTEYAVCVFPSASQPVMTVADSPSVLPQSMQWKFLGYNNEFFDSAVEISEEIPLYDVSGGLQLAFDVEPDHLYVEMKNKNGEVVFDDTYDKIDSSLFSDNTVYDVTVLAKWYESEERSNYGEATYRFTANVLSPAVFYLSNSSIQYGDFVIISAKNIVDSSLIGFQSEPSINFTPVFFEYGGYYHALVPLSLDCIEQNNSANQYAFTLSYGGVYQELTLDVSVRKSTTAYPDFTLSQINSYRNEATLKDFDDMLKDAFANEGKELYWMDDKMLVTPHSGAVRHGFGCNIILSASKTSYVHEGVDFRVAANDTATSCLPGEVVYVGETTLSGKTIVVDHGGGLKSLYAHLSSTAVKVGDVVEKGQIIGIVGSTGFCTGRTLHFGLYVFDVPVRYYSYEENGVSVAEAVAKSIGLNDAQ